MRPIPLSTYAGGQDGASTALADWLLSLSDFRVKAVMVLGPGPRRLDDDGREVIAVHPADFRKQAEGLASSTAYGPGWRDSGAPLVAWTNLVVAHAEDDHWMFEWMERGLQSLVRVDFPMPFGRGFECFMFAARPLGSRHEAAAIAWTALSIWPTLREECIARRFGLSARERQILAVMAQGLTARDAGAKVGCTERTVTFHLSNILSKLQVPNKAAAIQRACSLGLL